MRLISTSVLILVLSVTLGYGLALAGQGNMAPNGAHYNLNVIGVPKDKTADMDNSNRHVIFVKLQGKTKILLSEGEYQVLDGNGTDGIAAFQLPNPDPDNDGETEYSVWVRALGPGGSADMVTCAVDPDTGEPICSMQVLVIEPQKKNNDFRDVSRFLLYIYADLDGDGIVERYPLFDEDLEGYFWDYDNNGLKLAQFRFYEIPTAEPDPYE